MAHVIVHRRSAGRNQLGAGTTIGSPMECYQGTAYWDGENWKCPDGSGTPPPQPSPPVKTIRPGKWTKLPPEMSEPVKIGKQPGTVAPDDDLIFGFEKKTLLIVGAVAAGFYFMSQSGGKGK